MTEIVCIDFQEDCERKAQDATKLDAALSRIAPASFSAQLELI